ncbi:hypothetical protein [Kosakonia sacchari]|uniref:Uncharacterized protein n=1 Tax=Kosakonia sacchari TaxID=1158459 RepID=A0A1G4Z5K1_9ENTR|nr:hypothetical protein [Kosakonia sacchari]AHJ76172.1 hypothetical protein C813_16775 [Kosakonia sacchari SP1]MDN2487023.1 hypothetical protein [Kosakonia sacchari]NUL38956.1 hypothetical protein [Kosakonia sacchari]SCX60933.1 hypothetical protein SAMN02927897_04033 [Kosakonia sacchari]
MVMDKNYLLFCAALSEVARDNCKAGINNRESELFLDRIYKEYLRSSLPAPDISWVKSIPKNTKSWMKKVLCENLLFMKSAPEWIREPSWRFIDDKAMVFIDQIEFADNEVINNNLAPGNVLYVFSGKKESDDGWEMVIKMVMQDRNSVGTSFID